MSSVDVQLVKDDRIALSDKKTISVLRGGAEVYSQSFKATSETPNLINFSVNPASLNTLITRGVKLRGTIQFKVMENPATNGQPGHIPDAEPLFKLGVNLSPTQGGVQSLCENSSLTINNQNANLEYGRVYKELLRLFSEEELAEYFSEVPIAPDTKLLYETVSADNAVNNPLASYDYSQAYGKFAPRGSYLPSQVGPASNASAPLIVKPNDGYNVAYITYDFSENLIMPPFSAGRNQDVSECLFGVNNINLQLNLSSALANRFFSSSQKTTAGVPCLNVSIEKVENFYLDFTFLTLPPVFPLPPVSMVNMFNLPVYTTNINVVANSVNTSMSSSSITLNSIPEKILIYVKPQAPSANTVGDFRMPIIQTNISFGNKTGLLSSYTEHELYALSRRNGLKMTYDEWRGFASKAQNGANANDTKISTIGGMLLLSATDLSLALDQAPNEVSQITFQANVSIRNQTAFTSAQIHIVPIFSGILSSSQGQSQITYSNLNRSMVIDALEGKAEMMSETEASRMLGSGFWDTFKSVMKTSAPYVKQILRAVPDPKAQLGANLIETAGFGFTAGAKKSRFM